MAGALFSAPALGGPAVASGGPDRAVDARPPGAGVWTEPLDRTSRPRGALPPHCGGAPAGWRRLGPCRGLRHGPIKWRPLARSSAARKPRQKASALGRARVAAAVVGLSPSQTYRLVVERPERLSMKALMATRARSSAARSRPRFNWSLVPGPRHEPVHLQSEEVQAMAVVLAGIVAPVLGSGVPLSGDQGAVDQHDLPTPPGYLAKRPIHAGALATSRLFSAWPWRRFRMLLVIFGTSAVAFRQSPVACRVGEPWFLAKTVWEQGIWRRDRHAAQGAAARLRRAPARSPTASRRWYYQYPSPRRRDPGIDRPGRRSGPHQQPRPRAVSFISVRAHQPAQTQDEIALDCICPRPRPGARPAPWGRRGKPCSRRGGVRSGRIAAAGRGPRRCDQ